MGTYVTNTGGIDGLAVCAGVGGLELGISRVYPSYRTVCYVEGEIYAASVLAARMEAGDLDAAPIHASVETFDATAWRGCVDLVSAGFPCQPFSVAGKQEHEDDERHIWPEIARIIDECEPALVFLENVQIRAFVEPWRDLRRLGFKLSRPFACTAAELGAGHSRRRVFVLAHHIDRAWDESGWRGRQSWEGGAKSRPTFGNANHQGGAQQKGTFAEERRWAQNAASFDDAGAGLEGWLSAQTARKTFARTACTAWWASEPPLERVVHGLPHRVDRDRALGNPATPQQAAFAFRNLMEETFG